MAAPSHAAGAMMKQRTRCGLRRFSCNCTRGRLTPFTPTGTTFTPTSSTFTPTSTTFTPTSREDASLFTPTGAVHSAGRGRAPRRRSHTCVCLPGWAGIRSRKPATVGAGGHLVELGAPRPPKRVAQAVTSLLQGSGVDWGCLSACSPCPALPGSLGPGGKDEAGPGGDGETLGGRASLFPRTPSTSVETQTQAPASTPGGAAGGPSEPEPGHQGARGAFPLGASPPREAGVLPSWGPAVLRRPPSRLHTFKPGKAERPAACAGVHGRPRQAVSWLCRSRQGCWPGALPGLGPAATNARTVTQPAPCRKHPSCCLELLLPGGAARAGP